jgi:hypothetical protein
MKPDKVIYTDGHDVVVTDSTLKIKSDSYLLNGITKASFWTIRPDRWPAVVLMLLGIIVAACGYLGLIPLDLSLRTDAGLIGGNTIALWTGIALFVLGIIVIAFTHEKYAVRIGTAEGEKNALVSSKREYVAQIVDAVHTAFDIGRSNNPPIHNY